MAQDWKRQNFDNFVCVFGHAGKIVQCQDGQKDYQEKVSYVFQEVACQKQGFFKVFFVVHNSLTIRAYSVLSIHAAWTL